MTKDAGLVLFDEAARLYDLGFGVHWIKPNSKAPVESGWAAGVREDIRTLKASIRPGFGLGVRLGAASKFADGTFLANLDVDIKSSDPKFRAEALSVVEKMFPGLAKDAPSVITGYGIRFFFRTKEPVKSRRLAGSNCWTKVFMPTSDVSAEQLKWAERGEISKDELAKGWRIRPAWEIEIMGAGKQVVLPPSIHPDTKKPYGWGKPVTKLNDLPLVLSLPFFGDANSGIRISMTGPKASTPAFAPIEIDYLDSRFSPAAVKLVFGEGVNDRSAAAFSLAISMVKSGFSDDEVLSVLTDRDTYIGEMAFEHRKTDNRANAADWARDYCLRKAKIEADAAAAFRNEAVVTTGGLTDVAAAEQAKVLVKPDERPWQSRLTRGGKDGDGAIQPTLKNTLLIIRNVVSPGVFRRDIFGQRDSYGTNAPWVGAEIGKALTDDDAVALKIWLGERFKFEPSIGTIYEAMTGIALNNSFHPVQDELRALPDWDGKPRIDDWLARHFQAEGDPAYLGQVFRKWLVASITRTFQPGTKFDWMPIFEGPQGAGKSLFGTILFGQKYFIDNLPNLADKDAALNLLGKRCIEFGELDKLRKNEIETVKAFVTRQFDTVRPPYGRKAVEYARGIVFLGSTNKEYYLVDDTGNRRFNPIKVGLLDSDALRRDRDQLWAEALVAYDLGLETNLYLEGKAALEAVRIQRCKQVPDDGDAMAEVMAEWLEREAMRPKAERFDISEFKLIRLFEGPGPFGGLKAHETRNIRNATKALTKLRFAQFHTKRGNVWRPKGEPK